MATISGDFVEEKGRDLAKQLQATAAELNAIVRFHEKKLGKKKKKKGRKRRRKKATEQKQKEETAAAEQQDNEEEAGNVQAEFNKIRRASVTLYNMGVLPAYAKNSVLQHAAQLARDAAEADDRRRPPRQRVRLQAQEEEKRQEGQEACRRRRRRSPRVRVLLGVGVGVRGRWR